MYEFRDGSGYSDPSLCPMLNACQQSIGNYYHDLNSKINPEILTPWVKKWHLLAQTGSLLK